MARIPKAELERLKREVSLERLVEAKGVELERHGQDLIGLCPFHADTSPSLVVTPSRNLWHCLGACQAGGSVVDWVMRAEGVSFRHAVELLREDSPSLAAGFAMPTGRKAKDGRTVPKISKVPKLAVPVERDAETQQQIRQVMDYYYEVLKKSPEALGYLEKRGLCSSEMVDHFRLGFSDRTLGYRLPHSKTRDGAAIRGALREVGILRESGHEHFRGSLVVPIFDVEGRVVEAYGRKISTKLTAGTPNHLYLPGPHRGVWNLQALQASREVILCESLIDALTFWCAGYRNVTSSYGIEGFTSEHLEAFSRHGTERVLIAYDRDDAGDKAAAKLAEKLMVAGLECFRVQFPRGMDVNEYALAVQPASQSLGVAIRSAVWLGKGGGATTAEVAPSSAVESGKADPPVLEETEEETAAMATLEETAEETPEVETAPATEPSTTSSSSAESPVETDAVPPEPSPSLAAEAEPLSASPVPAAPAVDVEAEVSDAEVVMRFGDRRWRVRGLAKNTSYEALRVNVLCAAGESYHVDSLDLYSARHRAAFLKQAVEELGAEEAVLKKDLGKVLLKLEQLQDQQIRAALSRASASTSDAVSMTEAEREEALSLLRDPRLLERILEDFDRCGVVGERTNKLVGYIAAVSRKQDKPLALIIQSTSAAGKSALMDAVLAFVPREERVKYSAMTGQSLFYMEETSLKHKVLAIAEEEGAERASYALKLLQSEGEVTIASTGKDPATGRHVTHEYRSEGPVTIMLTTTAVEIDEELLNRCLVLSVDEEREQTQAIHRVQRESDTLEGLHRRQEREHILVLHQNAQRLLRPLQVVNPYARELTFLDDRTRTRRDHLKYLSLIRTLALLHQHQRPLKTTRHRGEELPYVEVTLDDIAMANRLAHEVLGRTLDELPPQTRRFLLAVDGMVRAASEQQEVSRGDYRFSRRELREQTRLSYEQVRVHLRRLVELEYVLVHRGRRGQSYEYELLWDGEGRNGSRFVMNLLDVEAVRSARKPTTESLGGLDPQLPVSESELPVSGGGLPGQKGGLPGSYRPHTGPIPGGTGVPETALKGS